MQIGIMLRSLDEKGGIGVYTRNVTQELLDLDQTNHYHLFYRTASHLGRFADRANVTEHLVSAPNKATWDQISIPYACWKARLDVVFHPKFTVPLLAPCKTVMVLHGAGWFMPEYARFWKKSDLLYVKTLMPIYCRRASAILSVSQLCADIFNRRFRLPQGKVRTVYFGPASHFRRIVDREVLQQVRGKYKLPPQFILTLSGYDRGKRKNIRGILEAYRALHGTVPHKLVVAGKDCHNFRADYGIPDDGYGQDILFPGWVDQEDLPAFYSLADLFLYPSHAEAFPIPVTEAMACGTPIITSNTTGLKEIAGDAALQVNPDDVDEIATAVRAVLSDPGLRDSLSARALARSRNFTWQKCARETLHILESVAG